jgi:hypothetical protein
MTTALPADLEQDDLLRHIASQPIPSAEEQKRRALVSRLACVLQEISEKFPGNTALVDAAMSWRSRPDFEQHLDEWEAGDHPALRG